MPIDNLYETPPVANIALLQGTLDVLILKVLALQRMHGLGIARRIAQVTNGTFQVKPGSLFPALHRMEESGWLAAEMGRIGKQQARQVLSPHQGGPTKTEARNR